MLTDQEINHITKLARLELPEELRDRMKKDLSSILGYIEQLERVDTAGVEPLYQVTGLQNGVRPDGGKRQWVMDDVLSALLIEQAPHHRERYVQVKAIKSS